MPEAALLTAAGRFADARDALDRLAPRDGWLVARERRDQRVAYQLHRFLDSGGDPRLIPSAPPPSRFAAGPLSFSQLRAEAAKRSAAVDAVRRSARGRTRDHTRKLLEQELGARGVASNGALWTEETLDHLWDTRGDQIQSVLGALGELGRLGSWLIKALRDGDDPDLSLPHWLDPPDHALYEFPHSLPRVGVILDHDAWEWLDQVYEALPHPLPTVSATRTLTAWITTDPLGGEGVSDFHVYLGQRRVGTIPAQAAEPYRAIAENATAREKHPCMEALLTKRDRPPNYVLDMARPA